MINLSANDKKQFSTYLSAHGRKMLKCAQIDRVISSFVSRDGVQSDNGADLII